MKVGIVGVGYVGSATGYAMVLRGSCRELVLIDKNEKKAVAEAHDMLHAAPFSNPVEVYAGTYADLKGAEVVILAAGVNQLPGESRLALLERNAAIFREIVPQVLRHESGAILIVATNPVDIITALTEREAGGANPRVFGSGTTLDTARFRALLGGFAGVDARHVHAYVVGEHGDSEVLVWSGATIAGLGFEDFCRSRRIAFSEEEKKIIDENVRRAAYKIIEGKGATAFGIGAVLARITESILRREKAIYTISRYNPLFGTALSLPHVVSEAGAIELVGIKLSDEENLQLEKSATVLKSYLEKL
ncbi:MAG: L-lactate dehydrogenase [Leptospiraceae bacterium]|nr:L-lactate dehydrogenase [Leptospiraceae bacterium]MDW8305721.1 L-lactate dehydrogenase [Leptospiraceae bacterium]